MARAKATRKDTSPLDTRKRFREDVGQVRLPETSVRDPRSRIPRRVAKGTKRVKNVDQGYSGRLELTWTNKHLRLLAHEDGTYEWLPRSDYRVAEVRLLRDAGTTGEVHSDRQRAKDNLLIRGDALHALTSLTSIPEFRDEYVGKVKLVYIDPPFNTQQAFEQYDDALEHSVWLTMMRDRLLQIKKLLAPNGSVWVHLDDAEMAYSRVMMDEVFGRDNFVATVVWEKSDSPRMDAQNFSGRHDYILVYSKSETFRVNRLGRGEVQAHYNKVDEEGVPYYLKPLRAMGGQGSTRAARPTLYYPLEAPDGTEVWPKLPDGGDGAWRWKKEKVERDKRLIEWIQTEERGWAPYFRVYDKGKGRPPETIWPHTEVGSNRTSKREIKQLFPTTTPFATPKPERLMRRIVEIGSNPGEVVLDCFAGSGTTAAVAQKMGRRWVTSEWSRETLETFTGPRLEKVIAGTDPGGVTEEIGWQSGGGFRVLDVAPSMFELYEEQILLAEWAVDSALSEATAAQFGYTFDPELVPFAGRKGRTRLAVVDGLANEAVVELLLDELPEDEKLCLCATMLDPVVRELVRERRRGSTVRKIPESILADYQREHRWWDRHAAAAVEPVESEDERNSAGAASPAEPEEAKA